MTTSLRREFARLRELATITLASTVLAHASLATGAPLALNQVRSFTFAIAVGISTPGFYDTMASSVSDLIIIGGGDQKSTLDRNRADPSNTKLILNYIDVTEASSYATPELFKNGLNGSVVGAPIPGYVDLYSVRYWDPIWRPIIYRQIDDIIAAGYDGIFLDVLDGYLRWTPDNSLGNSPYAEAAPALAELVTDIREHVASKHLRRPFFLIGNNLVALARLHPSVLSDIDAVFQEWTFWGQPIDNGLTSVYMGTLNATYARRVVAPFLQGKVVFGNDYPNPLSNLDAVFAVFSFYDALDWVPSVTTAFQTDQVFRTGPFMFTATATNASVTGAKTVVNFISGGRTPVATLIGGDQGDYFIGGTGRSIIRGGNGDDTIYAHPENVLTKNLLKIQVVADVQGVPNPSVSIAINGIEVLPSALVTASFQNQQQQEITVNTSQLEPVVSLKIAASGSQYIDANHYTNVQIQGMSYQGAQILLAEGSYDGTSHLLDGGASAILNTGGNVTFASPTLPRPPPTFGGSDNLIDGGGGSNTVIYRTEAENYAIASQADGSVVVTPTITNEGPDTLRNIRYIQFSNRRVDVLSGPPVTAPVVEYYNAALDHYFVTWVSDEIAKLDAGTQIRGWARTGQSFRTYRAAQTGTSAVCRYYIPPDLGDSHFFGRGTDECGSTGVKNPRFVLESSDFMQLFLPTSGVCPANTQSVYRVFSNRSDANHRYMTDKSIRDAMVGKGWTAEGDGPDLVVMCAPV